MNVRRESLVVASGATVSTHFSAGGFSSFGIVTPANLAGTVITFEVGISGSGTIAWVPLNNLGTAALLNVATVVANKAYKAPDDLRAFEYFRLITPAQSSGAATFVVFGKSGA
jgi:hypothetical protein